MALYELKEFLNFDDVAEYLKDKGVYDFDLSDERDYQRLKDFLFDLAINKNITPIFYYNGCVVSLLNDWFEYKNSPDFDPYEPYTTKGNEQLLSGYFIADYDMLNDWQNGHSINYIQSNHNDYYNYEAYSLYGYKAYNEVKIYALTSRPKGDIDLLFPKLELDQLLLQQKRDNLQSQIDVIDNQLNERTENSYLTTIGLLLELLKTPKGFDKDNKPNKPLFDSDAQIIRAITDYKIYGQGESTLENRFGKANAVLDQAKKK